MDQILPPKLTDLELEASRQIAVHPAACHIPYPVQSRLKDIGYAKEVLGGLVLTDDGLRACLATAEKLTTFARHSTGLSPYPVTRQQETSSRLRMRRFGYICRWWSSSASVSSALWIDLIPMTAKVRRFECGCIPHWSHAPSWRQSARGPELP
jgi:hypothetical protein